MWPSGPARSISPSPARLAPAAHALQAVLATWRAMSMDRLRTSGIVGYVAIWLLRPVFELIAVALIYGTAHPTRLRYVVVALAANAFVFNAIFYVSETLDRERINGTLVSLFLAPCPRFSWLSGFTLVGGVETALIAAITLVFGHIAFGVTYHPDLPAVVVALALFLAALWGLGYIFAAIGLLIKKATSSRTWSTRSQSCSAASTIQSPPCPTGCGTRRASCRLATGCKRWPTPRYTTKTSPISRRSCCPWPPSRSSCPAPAVWPSTCLNVSFACAASSISINR